MTHPLAHHGRGHEGSAPATHRGFRDRGASLVEYALLVALITVACLAALTAFGDENEGLVNGSADKIVNAPTGP